MTQRHAVVVGAGVIGSSCAHYLMRAGWRVTLIDMGRLGGGTSYANCGLISPSHVLPLAGPDVIWPALKSILRHDSPLAVRWRYDPALWNWLYRFARRCNEPAMLRAAKAIDAMLRSSRQLYDQLFANGLEADFQPAGLLMVYRSADAMKHHGAAAKLLREQFGLTIEHLNASALATFDPSLRDGMAGAWLYPGDAHVRPDRLMRSWRNHLLASGVNLRERCPFHGFIVRDGKVAAVDTERGDIPCDAAVVATGVWTPLLARSLGVRVPIQPGKGFSMTMPRPDPCPRLPMIFEEVRVAVTPFSDGLRLGSTMEFAGFDRTMNRRRLRLLTRGAKQYLRTPTAEPIQEEWWGWRPMIYDGLPIISRTQTFDNVFIAAGHGMLGLSMAPATGRLITELVNGSPPHVEPRPYSVTRF